MRAALLLSVVLGGCVVDPGPQGFVRFPPDGPTFETVRDARPDPGGIVQCDDACRAGFSGAQCLPQSVCVVIICRDLLTGAQSVHHECGPS